MKKLDLVQMEDLQGQSNAQAVVCGIGIGMLFTPSWMIGAAIVAAGCLVKDSAG